MQLFQQPILLSKDSDSIKPACSSRSQPCNQTGVIAAQAQAGFNRPPPLLMAQRAAQT